MSALEDIKVVAHYCDGRLLKGTTLDFQPSKPLFHIRTKDEQVHEVQINELKAVFFVRRYDGIDDYKERKGFFSKRNLGRKVMVEFLDGEVIFGYTMSYSAKGQGFFMTSGDPKCNNEKVFIVHAAAKRVKIQIQPPKIHR